MPLGFGSHTSCTRFTIFLDKFAESGPGIIAADEVHCLILTGMSGEDVVVLVAENSELEVVGMNMPCLESRSTITRIESQLEDVGRVSMKSIEMEFHGRSGIRSCFSKP